MKKDDGCLMAKKTADGSLKTVTEGWWLSNGYEEG
jgi:hypothetical protein